MAADEHELVLSLAVTGNFLVTYTFYIVVVLSIIRIWFTVQQRIKEKPSTNDNDNDKLLGISLSRTNTHIVSLNFMQ